MGTHQFSLKQNHVLTDLLNSLKYLFVNQSLVDVTLACEGQNLKAHKVILAAYSPYFQTLFSENPCSHPIVFMKNVKYGDLKFILDFMYRGEVSVPQHQLASVVKTAQELNVQGLEEVRSDERQEITEECPHPFEINVPGTVPIEIDMTGMSDNISSEYIDSANSSLKDGKERKGMTRNHRLGKEKDNNESELVLSEFPAFVEQVKTEIESSDDEYETNDVDYIPPQVSSVYSEYHEGPTEESTPVYTPPPPSVQNVQGNVDELSQLNNSVYDGHVAPSSTVENDVKIQNVESTIRKRRARSTSRMTKKNKKRPSAEIPSVSHYVDSLFAAAERIKGVTPFTQVQNEEQSSFAVSTSKNKEDFSKPSNSSTPTLSTPVAPTANDYQPANLANEDEAQETICVEPDIFIPSGEESGFSHSNASYHSIYAETDQSELQNSQVAQEEAPGAEQEVVSFGATGYLQYPTDNSQKDVSTFENLNDASQPIIPVPITEEEKPKDTIRRPKKYKLGTHRRKKAVHKSFSCDICYKRFRYESALVIHRRVHTGEKPFPCGLCDKWFARKDQVQVHQQVHDRLFRKQEMLESGNSSEMVFVSQSQIESSYTCDICNKSFRQSTHLERHKLIHTEEKQFACDICNKQFLLRSSYAYHMKTHRKSLSSTETGETSNVENNGENNSENKGAKKPRIRFNGAKFTKGSYPCPVCKKKFEEKSRLIRHEVVHSEEKPFICDVCGKAFRRKDNLKSHHQTHIRRMLAFKKEGGEPNSEGSVSNRRYRASIDQTKLKAIIKRFVCNICSKRFRYNSELLTHRRTHTGEKPFGCDICGKRFAHNANLRLHQFSHMGFKPHSCPQCGTEFLQKYQLAKHIKSCKGEKLHACNLCNRTFPRAELQMHLERHAGREPFTCGLCGKSFSYQYQLDKHSKACKGELLHACHICNRSFNSDDLKSHLERHAGKLPFICDLCGKGFAYKYQLDSHLRSCKGEKLHSCHICRRSYTSEDLASHLERHAGRLPFVCDLCGKGFSYRYMLDTHAKICKGERTHTCHICNRSFNSDDLQSHLERHAGKLPFVCDLCGKGFSYKFKLIRHRETHIREKVTCDKCGKTFSHASKLAIHSKTHAAGRGLSVLPEDNEQEDSAKDEDVSVANDVNEESDDDDEDDDDDVTEESDVEHNEREECELDFTVDQDESLHYSQETEEDKFDDTSDVEIVVD